MNSLSTYNRTHPYLGRIKERFLLTKDSSTRKTYHIVLDLSKDSLGYAAGDSVAVLPENNPQIVDEILESAGASGSELIMDPKTKHSIPFRSFLQTKANLCKVAPRLVSFLTTLGAPLKELLEEKEKLASFLASHHVIDLLTKYPKLKYRPQELAENLLPLLPRFYSIASSSKMFPGEIHLTISFVSYELNGQSRYGVASYFLCKQAEVESTPIPLYIQPSNGFTLPSSEDSIILIGPGTGVAPFRAFLQERLAENAKGRNWLFFGERHQATDFYYESFFKELEKKDFLRLDTAFSRDGAGKVYVQHKLMQQGAAVWDWLQSGAFLYVCGDAEKMAGDVEKVLEQIAQKYGNLSSNDAHHYLKRLRKEKRYLLDVY